MRALLGALLAMLAAPAWADDPPVVQITLKDHRFDPAEIHIPAGRPTMLEVTNADPTPDEFEMRQIAIEKVVTGGGKVRVRLRPMAPGRYEFIGEFNEATAKGVIVAE